MANYPINKDTDWISKEKRELFCKTINTLLMSEKRIVEGGKPLDTMQLLGFAREIVDRAFELYPDKQDGQEKPL